MTYKEKQTPFKRIGPDLIAKVQKEYNNYIISPNPKTREKYLLWRLRVHLRCNEFWTADLINLNEQFSLGLNDSEVGPLMWELVR